MLATRHRLLIAGAAFHHDHYERGSDGRWRVAGTRCVRNYETMVSLDDLPSFKLTAALAGLLDGQAPDPQPPDPPAPGPPAPDGQAPDGQAYADAAVR
jgi:hypothetical protein